MKRYKNVSGRSAGFLLDGKTYGFQSGQVVSVPDNFKERIEDMVTKIVPYEELKPEPVVKGISIKEEFKEKPKKEVKKEPKEEVKIEEKYSKTDLKDMNKREQIEILNHYKVYKIPRKEKDRIKLILKLQKESK